MNQPPEAAPGKIVPLGPRGDARGERVGDLLVAARGIAQRHLQALTSTLFDNVDDALFDLAEKAESNAAQTQFFDGMREARKKRTLTERLFLEEVARSITELAAGKLRSRGSAEQTRGGGELSLVEDSELEESLAVGSMGSKAEMRLSRVLFALHQRLAVICGGVKLDDTSNPLAPAAIAQAFRMAQRELAVETRVRLIIYKLFDRYVMSGLDPLYDELNITLARAGVLPQLRYTSGSRARGGGGGGGGGGSQALDADPGDTMLQAELVQTLGNLLAARRGHAGSGMPHGGTTGNHAPLPGPAELLGALSLLQGEISKAHNYADADEANLLSEVQQIKDQLLAQVAQLSGQAKGRVSGADEDTIDLVGMLFEFILKDRNLPAEMQVLLARLQIPYLKVAILDRRLFAQRNHPARRLLDALADAAKGWSQESDRDQQLLGCVRGIVERLLQEFDDDLGIFQRLHDDLAAFLDSHRKRADIAEQRAAEAARGREKLQDARRRAAREILARIEGRALPPLVQNVLVRPWANYMVLTLLRHGEDSPEFRATLRFVDDFVWSAEPRRDPTERERLRNLLPGVEKALRQGLATVAFQEADVARLMGELNLLYRQQLGEAAALIPDGIAAMSEPSSPPVRPLSMPESIEAIAVPEVAAPAEDVGDDTSPEAVLVRELKPGCWIEFIDAQGARERAKLSWISPISGRYLFVNRRGLKVADKTVAQLSAELRAGTAQILEEVPLFDRALDAIVERLRQGHVQAESIVKAP
ncbi:MAG: DUF1631 domain-containing protein [Xanthomonadaceae bacterium]|nr:DUF1631 domain-containing protein [Xanthomonadaceae bacterium]